MFDIELLLELNERNNKRQKMFDLHSRSLQKKLEENLLRQEIQ